MRRLIAGVLAFLLFCSLLPGLFGCGAKPEVGDLTAVFMSVGKADAILLYTSDTTVLIDTGYAESYSTIASVLRRENRETVDYLILTHFDKDHIGAAPQVLRNFPVGEVLLPSDEVESEEYIALRDAISGTGVAGYEMGGDRTISLSSDCVMRVNATAMTDITDENNYSLICEVTWGGFGMLLLGDALKDRVSEYLEEMKGTYQVVKTPHHGDYFKKLEECLSRAGTKHAIACVGPEREVEENYIAMCADLGITSWRTDGGEIRLTYMAESGEYTLTQG